MSELAKAEELRESVTLEEIAEQRRRNWTDFHPERYCHRCGRLNVWSWSAPSPLWNRVMRQPDGSDVFDGIVCPSCFAFLAESSGAVPSEQHNWRFSPDGGDDDECVVCGLSGMEHITQPSPTYHYEYAEQPNGTVVATPVLDGHFFLARGEIGVEDESEDLD